MTGKVAGQLQNHRVPASAQMQLALVLLPHGVVPELLAVQTLSGKVLVLHNLYQVLGGALQLVQCDSAQVQSRPMQPAPSEGELLHSPLNVKEQYMPVHRVPDPIAPAASEASSGR